MRGYVDELLPILLEFLTDASSSQKRELSLWTLSQLVESTGLLSSYVIHRCCSVILVCLTPLLFCYPCKFYTPLLFCYPCMFYSTSVLLSLFLYFSVVLLSLYDILHFCSVILVNFILLCCSVILV